MLGAVKALWWKSVGGMLSLAVKLGGCGDVVAEDLAVWQERLGFQQAWRVTAKREWRTLLLYRLSKGRKAGLVLGNLICLLVGREMTLHIACPDAGGGLFIQHGFATYITADRIGKRCWINQNVTIGWTEEGVPVSIGDDVRVGVGSAILGPVTVGDGVTVGAQSLVLRDVPAGITVWGSPTHHHGAHREWMEQQR